MNEEPREIAEEILSSLDVKVLVALKDILDNDEMYSVLIDDYSRSCLQDDELLNF